jgi:hypothetical protein
MTTEQYTTEQLNDIIDTCNEVIQKAKDANEPVAATLELSEDEQEGVILAANPQGQMMGFYVFRGVPLVRKVTDSPQYMAESLLTFISQFYDIHGDVDDAIELSKESANELAGFAAMVGAEAFGGF